MEKRVVFFHSSPSIPPLHQNAYPENWEDWEGEETEFSDGSEHKFTDEFAIYLNSDGDYDDDENGGKYVYTLHALLFPNVWWQTKQQLVMNEKSVACKHRI